MQRETTVFNPTTNQWEQAIPAPYPHSLLPWIWRRLTGWRDQYGRKAAFSAKEGRS